LTKLSAAVGLANLSRSAKEQGFSVWIIFPVMQVMIDQAFHCILGG
jgi:hypothetical protein